MPGRRYYCYYCDASFPYSREARKRHNSGHTHARLANRHYQQYHNARERYNTEISREKCRKFLSGNGCNFGEECIYSHTSPQELHKLKQRAEEEAILEEYGPLPSQVTSALSTPSATNVLTLDSIAVTKMIIAQRRKRLLSLYPAQLLPYTATVANNNRHQQPADSAQRGNPAIDGGPVATASSMGRRNDRSNNTVSALSTTPPGPANDALSSIFGEQGTDITRPLPSRTDLSTLLPPSMLPYTVDTMLSEPLPEWG